MIEISTKRSVREINDQYQSETPQLKTGPLKSGPNAIMYSVIILGNKLCAFGG